MKQPADFKSNARSALTGRWSTAVVAGFLASLFASIASNRPELNFSTGENGFKMWLEIADQPIYTFGSGWDATFFGFLTSKLALIVLAALALAVVYFVVNSVIELGYARFNLALIDRQKDAEIGLLFRFFPRFKTVALAKLLRSLYVLLWSLLLIFPGIVAQYSYAMTDYILAEHPEMTAREAIAESERIMTGNRFRLFCLKLSFIGWDLLCVFTLGIGELWLNPYKKAAEAAFYREVSGTAFAPAYEATFEETPAD